MAKQLKFIIRPENRGGTQIEAIGFQGKGCTSAIDNFVAGMGSEVSGDHELKDEYHMEDTQRETETE